MYAGRVNRIIFKCLRIDGIAFRLPLDTIKDTIKFLGYSRSSVEVYGVSTHKKALIYRALKLSVEFPRLLWSGIWWRRGDLNS